MSTYDKKASHTETKPVLKLSIRTVLITLFLVQVTVTTVIVSYLALQNSSKSVRAVTDVLIRELNTKVKAEITGYFEPPLELNVMNENLVTQKLLDVSNQNQLITHFSAQIKAHNNVNSISYANPAGGLANAGIDKTTGKYYIIYTDGFQSGKFSKYALNAMGQKTELVTQIPDFDARTRPWYQRAVSQKGMAWSDVYVMTTGDALGVTASTAVRDDNARLIGVVAVDLFLSDISKYLTSLEIGKGGQTFIMEKSGLLIASSHNDKLFAVDSTNHVSTRTNVMQSESPIISSVARRLHAQYPDFSLINSKTEFEMKTPNELYLVHVLPFIDLPAKEWLLISVIPKSSFMAEVHAINRTSIYLFLAAFLVTILAAILLARTISKPILRLDKKVHGITQGEWTSEPIPSRISEIDALAVEIYNMRTVIKSNIEALSKEIIERKHAEEHLRESESNYRYLFETAEDMIFVCDRQGAILYANPAVRKQLGYTLPELIQMHILDLHEAQSLAEAEVLVNAMFQSKRDICPLPLVNKDGIVIPVETRVWLGMWDGKECLYGISKGLTQEQEELHKYNLLFQSNPSPMAVNRSADNRLTDVNDAWLRQLGFTRDEAIGRTSLELGILAQPEKQADIQKEFLATGRVTNFEMQIRHKNGTLATGLFSGEMVEIQNENYFLSVMVDITERKRAESVLQDIIDKNPLSIQMVDKAGYTIKVNAASIRLFGVAPPRDYCVFADQQISGQWQAEWVQRLQSGEVIYMPDMCYNVHDLNPEFPDKPIWVKAVCFPLNGKDGKPECYILMHEDVTIRKQAEQALIAAKESAEESDRLKSSFLANMSHELRTPLSGILGFSELLSANLPEASSREMADMINLSGNRLLNTLNLILDLSQIEANIRDVHSSAFDVNLLVKRVVSLFEPCAVKKTITLDFRPQTPDLYMVSDPSMLEHVINELISNAIKYTDAGGVMITSGVTQSEKNARIIIEVADTGIGIPSAQLGSVFDAFRQVSEGWDRSYEGTGLGLTICKQYIRLLGGEIMIDSELGKGSKFTLSFPGELVQNPTSAVSEPAIPQTKSTASKVPGEVNTSRELISQTDPELPRILLVDDDELCHILVAGALSEIVTLDYSTNAADALLLAKEYNYPLILLDINLKRGLSGIDVLNDLKLMKSYIKVPIIAVTAYAMLGDREKFLSMGFVDFVSKPFTGINLITTVKKWLNK